MFYLRDSVLKELESVRKAKNIGKSLDARVWLLGKSKMFEEAFENQAEFKELINVSEFFVDQEPIESEPPGAIIAVNLAEGVKCERCWHREKDIGQSAEHPTLCSRCVEAVKQLKA